MTLRSLFALLTAAALLASAPAARAGDPAETAKRILADTGVRGGLIVHVHCGDGSLTAALADGTGRVVQGLLADAAKVAAARAGLTRARPAGEATVTAWHPPALPYIDGVVNLLVVEGDPRPSEKEILRVLAPGGVACLADGDGWRKLARPRPKGIDRWTHFLRDASNNAVAADDRVAPPRHMHWLASPMWSRNHHVLASISGVVSGGRRLFAIVDRATAASMNVPGRWSVVARDAFSGVELWRRSLPDWAWHRQRFRSGPVQLPRLLVTDGEAVYVTLGLGEPVTALSAETGETLRTYAGTKNAEEIVLHDGVLMVIVGTPAAEQAGIGPKRKGTAFTFPNRKAIVAFDASTGQALWRWPGEDGTGIVPLTLAAAADRAFCQDGPGVVCLELATGKRLWRHGPQAKAEPKRPAKGKKGRRNRRGRTRKLGWSVATLVVRDGVVLSADARTLRAISAEDGKEMWTCPCRPTFHSPVDVLVVDGTVWLGQEFTEGRDLKTGKVSRKLPVAKELWTVGHHHRCYRNKATERFILTAKRGVEFLDLAGEAHSRNNWVRGVCQYGVLPCNGLLYAPSHACGCYMEGKLYGFWALSAKRSPAPEPAPPLTRGPAYGEELAAGEASPDDWPTYRGDVRRSGSTAVKVPEAFEVAWSAELGRMLTAPVVADGMAIVADTDAHRVLAVAADDGRPRWAFTASGRVDSAPTIHAGRVLFGSADGCVYCLRAGDGELIWRFRAARADLRTVARDQVESVWPVHGSVLVQGGVAWAAAGRSTYLDGGITLYGLDPATGKVLHETPIRVEHPRGSEGAGEQPVKKLTQNATDGKTFAAPDRSDAFSMRAARTDVPVGDGESVYLHHLRFDAAGKLQDKPARHLFSTSRLLDDAEVHRSHWVLGTGDFSRTPVAYSWIANRKSGGFGSRLAVPYGVILAFDDSTVWAVRRLGGYTLVRQELSPVDPSAEHRPDFRKATKANEPKWTWSEKLGLRPRAMAVAGDRLLIAGVPEYKDGNVEAFEARGEGLLWVVDAGSGKKLSERKLPAAPTWDSLAVTTGGVYLTTANGRLLRLGKR